MKFKDGLEIIRLINGLLGSLAVVIGLLNRRTGDVVVGKTKFI